MELDDSSPTDRAPLTHTPVDPDESVVVTVVRAVAAVANASVTTLPPLGHALDPEAIEELTAPSTFTGTVTFAYDEYVVRIGAGESVAVYGTAHDA